MGARSDRRCVGPRDELLSKHAGRQDLAAKTTIEELGLSSLERVELMVALEDAFQTHIDEGAFSTVQDVAQLRTLVEQAATGETLRLSSRWTSPRGIERCRPESCDESTFPTWILPLARVFAWLRVEGLENLQRDRRPCRLRRQSPESHGRAGDFRRPATALAIPGGARDGQGVFQSPFLPRTSTGGAPGSQTA